jgi:hypothetical protein
MAVSGRIGNKDIATESLNNFMSSVKELEWTNNNIYKPAKICDVRPTFVKPSSSTEHYNPKPINFDLFLIEENKYLANFQQYRSDLEDRKKQIIDKIDIKRKDFIVNYFPNDLKDTDDKEAVINQLKFSKAKVIQNSNLKSQLANYVSFLNSSQQNFNNTFNYNFQK